MTMDQLAQWLQDVATMFPFLTSAVARRLFETVGLFVLLWLARWSVLRLVRRRTAAVETLYLWRRGVQYVIVVVGTLGILSIWFANLQSLSTYLGLATAGIAIALSEPILNLAGWAFVLARQPFRLGDRIEISGHKGDVVDINPFQFVLLEVGNWVEADQTTGRLVHIPNREVFGRPVANWTQGMAYIWHELPVVVTFESDWRQAKSLLEAIVTEHALPFVADAQQSAAKARGQLLVKYGVMTPAVYTSVVGSGVRLTMRFLCPTRGVRSVSQTIWEAVLDAYNAAPRVDLAYDTIRTYAHWREGENEAGTFDAPVGSKTE